MKSWFSSTPAGDWVSMGVFRFSTEAFKLLLKLLLLSMFDLMLLFSDGSYGTPVGVMFSFPITIKVNEY